MLLQVYGDVLMLVQNFIMRIIGPRDKNRIREDKDKDLITYICFTNVVNNAELAYISKILNGAFHVSFLTQVHFYWFIWFSFFPVIIKAS